MIRSISLNICCRFFFYRYALAVDSRADLRCLELVNQSQSCDCYRNNHNGVQPLECATARHTTLRWPNTQNITNSEEKCTWNTSYSTVFKFHDWQYCRSSQRNLLNCFVLVLLRSSCFPDSVQFFVVIFFLHIFYSISFCSQSSIETNCNRCLLYGFVYTYHCFADNANLNYFF